MPFNELELVLICVLVAIFVFYLFKTIPELLLEASGFAALIGGFLFLTSLGLRIFWYWSGESNSILARPFTLAFEGAFMFCGLIGMLINRLKKK
jgi:hypothetical protein